MTVEQGVSLGHDRDRGPGPMYHQSVGSRLDLASLGKIESWCLENQPWAHVGGPDRTMAQGLQPLGRTSLGSCKCLRVCDQSAEVESVLDC